MGVVINVNVAIFSRSAPVCNDAQWLEHSSSMLLLRCFLYTIFFLGFPNANPMQLCLFILILCSYSYLLAKVKDKIPKFEASLCLHHFYGTICAVKLLVVEFGKKRSYKKVFASVITCRSMGDILFCYDKQPIEIFVIPDRRSQSLKNIFSCTLEQWFPTFLSPRTGQCFILLPRPNG